MMPILRRQIKCQSERVEEEIPRQYGQMQRFRFKPICILCDGVNGIARIHYGNRVIK